MESVRPRLPIHADSSPLAARIAEASVEGEPVCGSKFIMNRDREQQAGGC